MIRHFGARHFAARHFIALRFRRTYASLGGTHKKYGRRYDEDERLERPIKLPVIKIKNTISFESSYDRINKPIRDKRSARRRRDEDDLLSILLLVA